MQGPLNKKFQSRYRAASHFRRGSGSFTRAFCRVSISLSSGFSFQVSQCSPSIFLLFASFQSRYRAASHFRRNTEQRIFGKSVVSISLSSGFSFQGHRYRFHNRAFLLFQSRYRAASHFRAGASSMFTIQKCSFQSRYRAASHFRSDALSASVTARYLFQSRYRAASHFRRLCRPATSPAYHVSISLSSGFSFQVERESPKRQQPCPTFQSRYRAASHFRITIRCGAGAMRYRFNLVIERLLISGLQYGAELAR